MTFSETKRKRKKKERKKEKAREGRDFNATGLALEELGSGK